MKTKGHRNHKICSNKWRGYPGFNIQKITLSSKSILIQCVAQPLSFLYKYEKYHIYFNWEIKNFSIIFYWHNVIFISYLSVQFSSVAQLCPTLCDPMKYRMPGLPGSQAPTPGVYPNSCPLNQWCHPTISSPGVPFSSRLRSFPESGSFQMSQHFTSGGQSIGDSASTSVLCMNT